MKKLRLLVLVLVASSILPIGCAATSPFVQWESAMPERRVVAVRQIRDQEVSQAVVTTEKKFWWWQIIFRSSPIMEEERDQRTLIFQ